MDTLETRIFGLVISGTFFLIAAYFSRAGQRRIFGVTIASCLVAIYVMGMDYFAAKMNWWHYPAYVNGYGPIEWYITLGLAYGGALGFVGWRILRRFGLKGFAIFVIGFTTYGITRDYVASSVSNIIIFSSGPIPWIADFCSYASALILVQLILLVLVGTPKSDKLVRFKK